jgi:hypothetical protein
LQSPGCGQVTPPSRYVSCAVTYVNEPLVNGPNNLVNTYNFSWVAFGLNGNDRDRIFSVVPGTIIHLCHRNIVAHPV